MRSRIPMLGLVAVLVTGGAALAAAPAREASGQIKRVDAKTRTLVVEETAKPRHELTFKLASDVQIVSAGKTETISALKTGERVKVDYAAEGAHLDAQRVEVMPAKS